MLKQQPDKVLIEQAKKVIVKKDAAILAEAKQAKTNFLVTLDKKHFLTAPVRKFLYPQKPVIPLRLENATGYGRYIPIYTPLT